MAVCIFVRGIDITVTANTFWHRGWSSHVNHILKWIGVRVKGNSGKGGGDEDGVAQVSLTRASWRMPLYWSKITGVCVPPTKEWGLRGVSRYIMLYGG